MEAPKIFFTIPLFGGIRIDETIVNAFLITAVIFILCKVLTHKMEKIPHKKDVYKRQIWDRHEPRSLSEYR